MINNVEEDLESQQNELPSCDIETMSHLTNGRQPNLNISVSTKDEGEVRERVCSTDQNKVYAIRILKCIILETILFDACVDDLSSDE